MIARLLITLLCAVLTCAVPVMGAAQNLGLPDSSVVVIDPNRLFAETKFGQRVAAELEADGAVLAAENRQIEAELVAEEKELTQKRADMEPEAFRDRADVFDEKVQRTRREQEEKAIALGQNRDTAQRRFLNVARPMLDALMIEIGAVVLLDIRSVLWRAETIDVTDEAVRRVDLAIGAGNGGAAPDQEAPEE